MKITHSNNLLDKDFTKIISQKCPSVSAVVTTDVKCTGGHQPPHRRPSVKLFETIVPAILIG